MAAMLLPAPRAMSGTALPVSGLADFLLLDSFRWQLEDTAKAPR
jgi:hypothetical protein